MGDALAADLRRIVGADHVATDPDVVAGFATDWTGRFVGRTPAVVRPGTVDDVAAVVAWCAARGVAVVPQGGNTGLVGGGVPLAGEVVLSLRRLTSLAVDREAGQVTAGAGVPIARLHTAAAAADAAYGIDFSARDTATVGGSIATNAGGLRVVRYGDTRAQLLGVEAVLGDGSVVSHLGGLSKDNTGYHLPSLLCGSEGTLGVVTSARLRLVARTDQRVVALVGLASVAAALALTAALRRDVVELEAVELFVSDGARLVCETFSLPPPFARPWPCYLVIECAGRTDPSGPLADALDRADDVGDVAVAIDGPRRAALWRYREAHSEAINTLGAPHKLDVTLPHGELARFVDEVPARVAAVAPGARTWLFGHAADGNVHVNVTGVAPDDDRVDGAVLGLVAARGGSISAEHGIGTAKKRWLHLVRSDAEIAAFRAVKLALDPAGILNPNALLP
jgi:FAD/FMN-containing dehydrogenase